MARFFKSLYRKEPISSFLVIVAAVDSVIGGIDGSLSLLSFGITMAIAAVAVRWFHHQKTEKVAIDSPPRRFLPPSPQGQALPPLHREKRRR